MVGFALLIVLVIAALASQQLIVHGWAFFVDRPSGVGAS